MYEQTPNTLLLAGELGEPEMMSLANYCRRLREAGQSSLHVDMSGVTDCSRAGLDGVLALLAGSAAITVTVSGAHWAQFLILLSGSPVREIQHLSDSARALIEGSHVGA